MKKVNNGYLYCCPVMVKMGGSPGLVVMGWDSCSEGRGFESQHHILDGHFSRWFVVKIVVFVWKDENKLKRGREWSIKKVKNGKVGLKVWCFKMAQLFERQITEDEQQEKVQIITWEITPFSGIQTDFKNMFKGPSSGLTGADFQRSWCLKGQRRLQRERPRRNQIWYEITQSVFLQLYCWQTFT